MDVELTSEQAMLRDATRAFLESRAPTTRVREWASERDGFDPEVWTAGASLGWCAMLLPEKYGGAGLGEQGVVSAAVLAEELGQMLHPGPFLPVNVVADAVSRTGSDAQRETVLPGLAAGTYVATWAVADGPGCWDGRTTRTMATGESGGYVLRGVKRWVQDGLAADLLLVTCRDGDELVQVLVPRDSPGVTVTALATADVGRRLADVEFDNVVVPSSAVLGSADVVAAQAARQLHLAVVLQCAESVGATARVLEKTVCYAQDRVAFGRPIGSFQAVRHLLAESATWLEAAQAATWSAVRALADERPDLARAIHVAKAFVAEHCVRIIEDCMQVHGGIAMTWDDDCHLFLRRVASNAAMFGTAAWHADRLCDVIGMAA